MQSTRSRRGGGHRSAETHAILGGDALLGSGQVGRAQRVIRAEGAPPLSVGDIKPLIAAPR